MQSVSEETPEAQSEEIPEGQPEETEANGQPTQLLSESDSTSEDNGRHATAEKSKQRPLWQRIFGVVRTILIVLNNLWAVPSYVLWCYMLLPLRFIAPDFFQSIEQIPYRWLQYCVAHWLSTAGYEIHESGDDILQVMAKNQCLVVMNHQTTADVPMIMAVLADKAKYPVGQRVCWIIDNMFRYTHFGFVSRFHGDFFILQGRETRQGQLDKLKNHLNKIYRTRDRTCILLFPEGGFLYKRKESSQRYAQKFGYPVLEHTTLPRIGAMDIIMKTLYPPANNMPDEDGTSSPESSDSNNVPAKGKPLEYLIDVTIAYPRDRPLDIGVICSASEPPCRTIIHYRCYHINHVPCCDAEELHKWVYERWTEKEAMLDEYYKTGQFPSEKYRGMMNADLSASEGLHRPDGTLRKLPFDIRWCLFYNVIFLLSTCCHLYMFSVLWSLVTSLFI